MISRVPVRLAAVALALTPACAEPPPPPEPVLRPVRYQQVFTAAGPRTRTFSGVARPGLESALSFRVPGTVQSLGVKVGDRVRAGQTLARLDPVDYELQVKEAEAALRQAEAAARNATANLDRVRGLYEKSNASAADLDAARAAADSSAAQLEAMSKRLELAQRQAQYTHLVAPVSGAVAEVGVDVNENVGAGQTVVVVTAGEAPDVEIAVPEGLIARIEEGRPVRVTFDAIPGREVDGLIREVGVTATRTATTFPVTIRLAAPQPLVRPGMTAEVAVGFDVREGAARFVVPPEAVAEDREGRFVFVLDPAGDGTGTVHRRPVTVGELGTGGLEVVDGLADGDLVVTAGVSRLENGQRVRVADPLEG